jgi:DNA-binding transcriptional ArsR family regulator
VKGHLVLAVPLFLVGLLGAPASPVALDISVAHVDGTLEFDDARAEGILAIHAQDASLLVRGHPTLALEAEHVVAELVKIEKAAVADPTSSRTTFVVNKSREPHTLHQPQVEFRFGDAQPGVIYVYRDETTVGEGAFDLPVGWVHANPFHASMEHWPVVVTDRGQSYAFEHEVAPPVFGIGRGDLAAPVMLPFGRVDVSGAFVIVADYASIHARDATQDLLLQAGRTEQRAPGVGGLLPVATIERSYVVLRVEGGRLGAELTEEATSARFLSKAPTYLLNGSLEIPWAKGYADIAQQPRSLQGAMTLAGDLVIDLSASQRSGSGLLEPAAPSTRARVSGDVQAFAVNQRSILPQALPKEAQAASVLALVTGILLAGWASIQKLGAPVLLPLYARLTGKDLLSNESRLALLEVVRRHNIVHLRELQRLTGLGYGTVAYHAAILKSRQLVGSVRSGREEFFFQPRAGFPRAAMRSISCIANPVRRRLAEIIVAQGGATQEDLCSQMKMSRAFVSRQLAKLEGAGLLACEGRRNKVYKPTPLLLDWLLRGEGRVVAGGTLATPAS